MKQNHVTAADIDQNWLQDIAQKIKRNQTSIAKEAKNAHFHVNGNVLTISISHHSLASILKIHNLIEYSAGRKGKIVEISEEIINEIFSLYSELQCGITKMYAYCNKENVFGYHIPKNIIENIYSNYIHPEKTTKTEKAEKKRCRYNAKESNAIWHADIHYLVCNGERKYLYAIIDDFSRFIIYYSIVNDKCCKTIAEELKKAIHQSIWGSPLVYWSDNGGENIGPEILRVFQQNQIEHVRTLPANPQSNGKIERWWQGVEKRIKDTDDWDDVNNKIKQFTQVYNFKLAHSSLPKINGYNAYPKELYLDVKYLASSMLTAKISIDGRDVFLSDFVKKENRKKNDRFIPPLMRIRNLLN